MVQIRNLQFYSRVSEYANYDDYLVVVVLPNKEVVTLLNGVNVKDSSAYLYTNPKNEIPLTMRNMTSHISESYERYKEKISFNDNVADFFDYNVYIYNGEDKYAVRWVDINEVSKHIILHCEEEAKLYLPQEKFDKLLDAVNTVCGECLYLNYDVCETCPVRKTMKRTEQKPLYEISITVGSEKTITARADSFEEAIRNLEAQYKK